MSQPTVALVSPLNDPPGALVPIVRAVAESAAARSAWSRLRDALASVVFTVAPGANARTVEAIASILGREMHRRDDLGPGRYMWTLAELALGYDATHYFIPDTDRLLHWLVSHPDELAALPDSWGRHDVLVLARSERAFASHPPSQVLTEGPAKKLIADAIGLPGADPFGGAYLLSRRALEAILASDSPRDESFFAEAFLAPSRAGLSFACQVVEGLEWETPDRYPDAIAAQGYDVWLESFETPRLWRARAQMLARWIDRVIAHRRVLPLGKGQDEGCSAPTTLR